MSMKETIAQGVGSFTAGSLEARLLGHVYTLSHEIGNRNVECYEGLERACAYISGVLAGLGYDVRNQEYQVNNRAGAVRNVRNIIADKPGVGQVDELVIVGAHYDSCYNPECNPGADDNASAVAGMLELARLVRNDPTERTVRFVAFTCEEPPYFMTERMGSAMYARQARLSAEKIHVALILEMIGFFTDDTQDYRAIGSLAPMLQWKYPQGNYVIGFGDRQSLPVLKQIAAHYRRASAVKMVTNLRLGFLSDKLAEFCISDNLSFWTEGYKSVMLGDTSYVRNAHYHQPTDTYDTLDYKKMAEVVGGVLASLISF